MKFMVTGGAGFIGSHLVGLLAENGHQVSVVDNLSTGCKEFLDGIDCQFHRMDIRGFDFIRLCISEHPDVICHLAAQSAISTSLIHPESDLDVNARGTLNVIEAARLSMARQIVFASTSAVKGEALDSHPESPYGISKLAAEGYLHWFQRATILRLGNVYGPRQVPLGENQVVPMMIAHLLDGKDFSIHGDGEQRRNFIYVRDVAGAFMLAGLSEYSQFNTYNIANENTVSVNDMAAIVAETCGKPGYPWKHDEREDPRRDVYLPIFNANLNLGWKPLFSLVNGITRTVDLWKSK